MDIFAYNRDAWDLAVRAGNRWTVPVSPQEVAAARAGKLELLLTPKRHVPRAWFPDSLLGVEVLGLAAGGGQQGPLLAAAGARVTTLDASEAQLEQDRHVAQREGLEVRTVAGDMRDLSCFSDASFDLVFHPVSNVFVPNVLPVWREVARVLRPGGALLAGYYNPAYFLFDDAAMNRGELVVRYCIPYSDPEHCDPEQLAAFEAAGEPLCFGHSLTDLIGGQLDAGLHLAGMFEDRWGDKALDRHIASFIATRAVRC